VAPAGGAGGEGEGEGEGERERDIFQSFVTMRLAKVPLVGGWILSTLAGAI
jgi:hypothetical protein